jgi:hypothetical protein
MIVLRNPDQCSSTYRNSVAYIALDCDCCYVAGLGKRSGVTLFGDYPCYHITWPQHPEYHDHYMAITEDGIKWL